MQWHLVVYKRNTCNWNPKPSQDTCLSEYITYTYNEHTRQKLQVFPKVSQSTIAFDLEDWTHTQPGQGECSLTFTYCEGQSCWASSEIGWQRSTENHSLVHGCPRSWKQAEVERGAESTGRAAKRSLYRQDPVETGVCNQHSRAINLYSGENSPGGYLHGMLSLQNRVCCWI